MNLQDLCERIVRDAIPATDSGATCFVPRYQIDQLREALATPHPPAEAQAQGGGEVVAWQFQDREGKWNNFVNEAHRLSTIEDGTWPIRALYTAPPSAPAAQGGGEVCANCLGPRDSAQHSFAVPYMESHGMYHKFVPRPAPPPSAPVEGSEVTAEQKIELVRQGWTAPNPPPSAPVGVEAQVSALQSVRDRMMAALTPKFWDAFDGDFDVMLEAINTMKRFRMATLAQQPAAVDGAMAGWIADGDTIPADLISAARDAIEREFYVSVTDGYYKRILVRVLRALAAQPGGSDNG